MGFGYSLLSVLLYRALCFSLCGTAFFLLYLGVWMPLGALWASRGGRGARVRPRPHMVALAVLALLVPLLGLAAVRGPFALAPRLLAGLSARDLWLGAGWQALAVAPFFLAWGAAEVRGYACAMSEFKRPGLFFPLFLWASAAGILAGFFAVPHMGLLRTAALAVLAGYLAIAWWEGRDRILDVKRGWPYATAALCLLFAGNYGGEYTLALSPGGFAGTRGFVGDPSRVAGRAESMEEGRVLASVWGRYSHLTLVEQPGMGLNLGFSDGAMLWWCNPGENYSYSEEIALFDLVEKGDSVCILGSGGGRQVSMALARDAAEIVAVELYPVEQKLFTGHYAWANGRVYQHPVVTTVSGDGRQYAERCGRRFSVVFMPSVESPPAMLEGLFEPGRRLHTLEAFQALGRMLEPGGRLVVVKYTDVDERLYQAYAATLAAAGFHVRGLSRLEPVGPYNHKRFALIASKTPFTPDFSQEARRHFRMAGWISTDFDLVEPEGPVLFDDSPWLSGNYGNFLPPDEWTRFFRGLVVLLAFGVAVALFLGVRAPGGVARFPMEFSHVLVGLAAGFFAMAVEHGIIFWLIGHAANPMIAFFGGAMAFLALYGVAATMLPARWAPAVLVAAGAAGLGLLGDGSGDTAIVSLGLLALAGGVFFPVAALRHREGLVRLYVADAAGALCGGAIALYIPMVAGFSAFFRLLPWLFVVAAGAALVFSRLSRREPSL